MSEFALSLKSRLRRYAIVSDVTRSLRRGVDPGLHWMNTHLGSRTGRHFARARNYFVRNRVAGYIGWVGNGNVGDEAIFQAFRRLFPRHQALLFDRTPVEIALHRRFISGEPFYDFVTVGGGTLFSFRCYYYQLETALRHGVPVWTFGTGLDDPELMKSPCCEPCAPRQREHRALLRDFAGLLKDVPLVTVRGPRTARVLQELGVWGAQVIGDPALGACEPGEPSGGRRAAINLANVKDRPGLALTRVASALNSAVRYLHDKGWQVDFIPTARGDRQLGHRLVREFLPGRVRVLADPASPEEFIDRLAGYDLVIGERLHSLVLAAGSGVPCIGLEYSPKCRDFMESLDMERFCIDTASLSADTLIAAIDEADANRSALNRALNERCNGYRRLQRNAAAEVTRQVAPVAIA